MKKFCLFLLTIIVFSTFRSQAQGFHLGIKAGTNISELTGRSFDEGFQWNFMAGAFAELDFTSHWGIQPEVLFSQTTAQTANDFNDVYEEGINSRDVKLNYLSIPILLTYKLPLPSNAMVAPFSTLYRGAARLSVVCSLISQIPIPAGPVVQS